MATLAQFSRNVRRKGRAVENGPTALVKAMAKRSLRHLVRATPVDKGVARSNWRVGLGNPTSAQIPAYAPGSKLGIGESANASAAIAAGTARINSVRGVPGKGLTTAIYISNNVPYIEKLNSGSSSQAPAGFIETATQDSRSLVRGFRLFQRNFGIPPEDR